MKYKYTFLDFHFLMVWYLYCMIQVIVSQRGIFLARGKLNTQTETGRTDQLVRVIGKRLESISK